LELNKKIKLLGEIIHDNLPIYYQAADFLVISSYIEGWPTIIYEALACGTPVIAPNVGGIPEILNDENLGILVPNNKPESLANGIMEAFKKKWNINLLIESANINSWDNIAKKYIEIFDQIL
jgi:glycosyltransferase involved in cell wall biosynthesis